MKARHANIMVDLETLGISPGCTILSIGAVVFNPVRSVLFGKNESLTSEFYCVINRQSCKEAGLFEESKTIAWWDAQSIESKKVLSQADSSESLNIHEALQEFNLFVKKNGGEKAWVWGNGSDFDNAILMAAYRACGLELPWGAYNNRCYRTLKSISSGPKIIRLGTHHNALDDAKSQALHAIELLVGD